MSPRVDWFAGPGRHRYAAAAACPAGLALLVQPRENSRRSVLEPHTVAVAVVSLRRLRLNHRVAAVTGRQPRVDATAPTMHKVILVITIDVDPRQPHTLGVAVVGLRRPELHRRREVTVRLC